jgi:hypothetical protein
MSEQHVHRFNLGKPNGPVSIGVCACGETREYRNDQGPKGSRESLSAAVRRKALRDASDGPRVFPTGGRGGFTR